MAPATVRPSQPPRSQTISVSINDLASELDTDPQLVVDTARQMITTTDQKVLTVETSPTDDSDPVACLTDQAADAIRSRLTGA